MEYKIKEYERWIIEQNWRPILNNRPTEKDIAAFKAECHRKDFDPYPIASRIGVHHLVPYSEEHEHMAGGLRAISPLVDRTQRVVRAHISF